MSVIKRQQTGPATFIPMPVESKTEYDYTAAGGTVPTYIYEGPYQDCKNQYDQELLRGPSSMSLHRIGDSPDYRLTASYAFDPTVPPDPDNVPIVNTYELEDNIVQQHTGQSPYLRTLLGGATNVQIVINNYEEWKAKKITYDQASANVANAITDPALQALALQYLGELARGIESYINFHTVFRRTMTVVHPDQVMAAYTHIGYVWTAAQVIAAELQGADSDDVFFAFNEIGLNAWLKLPPRVISGTNQRTQISYEYWGFEEISSLYYPTWA